MLNYFINKYENIERLMLFWTIFRFISKVLNLVNRKVTRQNAQNTSILKLLINLINHSHAENKHNLMNE